MKEVLNALAWAALIGAIAAAYFIAIPAYEDEDVRKFVRESVEYSEPVRIFFEENKRFPEDIAVVGLEPESVIPVLAEDIPEPDCNVTDQSCPSFVRRITIEQEKMVLNLDVDRSSKTTEIQTLEYAWDPRQGVWNCEGGSLLAKYRPHACQ